MARRVRGSGRLSNDGVMARQRSERRRAATPGAYHHGNLRQELLRHAVDLARTGGPDAVSMRDVQRRAGVSNAAAYRHYTDRDALMIAVVEYARQQLAERMTEALAAVPSRGSKTRRATARLRATGQAYIDFALAEPGLFRTAFAAEVTNLDVLLAAEDVGSQQHPFAILRACIDDIVAAGGLSVGRRPGVDEACWAAVHGLATLFVDGALRDLDARQKQAITARLLDVVGAGI